VYTGFESGGSSRTYFFDLQGKTPRAVATPGFYGSAITRDGRFVLLSDEKRQCWLYPVSGGEPKKTNFVLSPHEFVLRFTDQGTVLVRTASLPAQVMRVDLATGRKELWKEISPADPAGVQTISSMAFSADGKSYAYSISRILSDLFVVSGLR
jgi:hypothetical protein